MSLQQTKSRREKMWTVERLNQIWVAYGCRYITDVPIFIRAVVNAHNDEISHLNQLDSTTAEPKPKSESSATLKL